MPPTPAPIPAPTTVPTIGTADPIAAPAAAPAPTIPIFVVPLIPKSLLCFPVVSKASLRSNIPSKMPAPPTIKPTLDKPPRIEAAMPFAPPAPAGICGIPPTPAPGIPPVAPFTFTTPAATVIVPTAEAPLPAPPPRLNRPFTVCTPFEMPNAPSSVVMSGCFSANCPMPSMIPSPSHPAKFFPASTTICLPLSSHHSEKGCAIISSHNILIFPPIVAFWKSISVIIPRSFSEIPITEFENPVATSFPKSFRAFPN